MDPEQNVYTIYCSRDLIPKENLEDLTTFIICHEGDLAFYKRTAVEEEFLSRKKRSACLEQQEYLNFLQSWLDYLPSTITSLKMSIPDGQNAHFSQLDDTFINALPRSLLHFEFQCDDLNISLQAKWPNLLSLEVCITDLTIDFLRNLPQSLLELGIMLPSGFGRNRNQHNFLFTNESVEVLPLNLNKLRITHFSFDKNLSEVNKSKLDQLMFN
jgi:hypothetical protein